MKRIAGEVAKMGWILLSLPVYGEVTELEPLVVEGHHFDEVALAVALGVKRIERSELENSAVRDIPEALARLAGLRIIDPLGNGAAGQVSLRGFGDNSGLRALILVDGQVYNPPDMGGINWTGIDIEQLETIEILRGGQTVLYGNHAVSGVIKLTTRKPEATGESTVSVGVGSDGDYRIKLSGGGLHGKAGLRAGASWQELDGYREHASLASRAGFLSWELDAWRAGTWRGKISLSRNAMELPGPLSYEDMVENPRLAGSGSDEVDSKTLQVTQFGEGTADWFAWEAAAGYLQRDREWNLDGRTADNELARLTLNPRIKVDRNNGYLIGGFDLAHDRVGHTGYLDAEREITLSLANLERTTLGGYIFESLDISDSINLSGGLRMESATTDNDNAHYMENQLLPELETNRGTITNPYYKHPPDLDPTRSYSGRIDKSGWAGEVSLLWRLSPQVSAWCGWDRVYRYPALDESAAYQGYPLSDPLNENLDPETGNNYEVGIKHVSQSWQYEVTAFYLALNDEISFVEYEDPSGGGLVRLNANIGDSIRKGVEANLIYRGGRYGWELMASWIDATLRTVDGKTRLPLVPRWQANGTVWIKPLPMVRLQLHGAYLSEQVQGNDFSSQYRSIPAYFLAHFSLYWDVSDRCDLVAGVNNLFDKTHASSAYSGGFYPGNGRQAHVTIRMGF